MIRSLRLLAVAALLASSVGCYEHFGAMVTRVRWESSRQTFHVTREIHAIERGFLGCEEVEGCVAALARLAEFRLGEGSAPADQLLMRLIDSGAAEISVEFIDRDPFLDAVIRYEAPLGTKAADDTQVFVEWSGPPGKERYYLAVQSWQTLELLEPAGRPTRRVRTYAGPGGASGESWWLLPQDVRSAATRLPVDPEPVALFTEIAGLRDRLAAAGRLVVPESEALPKKGKKPKPTQRPAQPKPAPEPEPIATAAPKPEPVAPKPEPVAAKPEPVAPKPEPVAAKPEPVAPKPEPVAPKPEPVAPRPEPVAPRPEPVAPRPEPVAAKPEPVVAKPEPAPATDPVPAVAPTPRPTLPARPSAEALAALPGTPRVVVQPPQITGPVSPDVARASVEPLLGATEACWLDRLVVDPKIHGYVAFVAVVRPDGTVASTTVLGDLSDPAVLACLRPSVAAWGFPWPHHDGPDSAQVVVPVTLWLEPKPAKRRGR